MGAAAGILAHQGTAVQALTDGKVTPMASSTTGSTGSTSDASGDSATISANDFLTLLVTEMQNQDPTADVDPNEYIDQLVQVNSLEQLISINQTLNTDLGAPASSTASNATDQSADATAAATGARPATAASTSRSGTAASALSSMPGLESTPSAGSALQSFAARLAPGNLGVPASNPSAERVAHALDGRRPASPNAAQ